MSIHPTAIVHEGAKIGGNCTIGPYAVIEGTVTIGDDCSIGPSSIITGRTVIGKGNKIHGHVYIGNLPQDIAYKGAETYIRIGDNNIIREFATVHRGTKEGSETVIGNNNFLMVAAHVAHNCRLGDNIVMVNCVGLGGYVEIGDHAFLGGFVAVHQFVRIGGYSICGVLTKVTKDVPPFMMVDGNPALVRGLNLVGLKRKGFGPERREALKKAYKIMYRSGFSISHSLRELEKMEPPSEDVRYLADFIKGSRRGVLLRSPGLSGRETDEE
jgi:UDP-N-acetylglucosamine acyltransferase